MRQIDHSVVRILENLQTRVIRIEKELQIHDDTRKRQTQRNDEMVHRIKQELKNIANQPDPYV
jgi:hypothetical protein